MKDLPPTYFFIALVLSALPFFFLKQFNVIPFPFDLIGIVPVWLGVQLNGWAAKEFKKRDTPHDFSTPTALVDSGILGHTRNPMYLGMILVLVGAAVLLQNPVGLVGALMFYLVMEFRTIPYEERMLARQIGEEYLQYKSRVRRWI